MAAQATMNSVNFKTRKDVFLLVQNVDESEKLSLISNYIISSLQMESIPDDLMGELDQTIRNFLRSIKTKLNQYNRHVDRLLRDPWLSEPFKLPPRFLTEKENLVKNSGGRPKAVDFGQLSASGQRKRTQQLRTDFSTDELDFAAKSKKRLETRASGKPADKVSSSTSTPNDFVPFNAEEMAAIIQICKLTKASYLFLRQALKSHGADVFPNYDKIWKGKNVFYPDDQDMTVSDSEAVIPVQALFDLTATRIVRTHSEVFESSPEDKSVTMLWKWGFDGSSGHVEYNQFSSTPNLEEKNIILVGAVPLQIYAKTIDGKKKIYWNNKRPGSPDNCRPLQLLHAKETKQLVTSINDNISAQIVELRPCVTVKPDLQITHEAYLTMIDGKIKNFITDTTNSNCGICVARPSTMNDIERWFSWPVDPASFTPIVFPVLHAWLRSLELCLNIIERLDIADSYLPYQKYTQEQKALMKARKNEATDQLRNGIGILVGKTVSSQVGTGSSNNGNTARRFFENPALTAELTGLNEEFLEHLRVVLIVVSSGFAIDVECFRKYTKETAQLYVTHYNWYWMSASVHTLLVHGPDFVKLAPVPLGLLSEEALEACHKRVRHIRKHHVQLWNRVAGMKDLIHGLLIASDPITNTLRTPPKRKNLRFGTTVLSLLTDKDADPEEQACDAFDEASN